MSRIYGLDLFSGGGGLALALQDYVEVKAYCEQGRYQRRALLERQADLTIDHAPIWNNVRTLDGSKLPFVPEIITAGFPCQDISCASQTRTGLAGKRSGLFFEVRRLADEIRPAFVFLENVPAIRTRGAQEVSESLAALGYDQRWGVVSASQVGAPHRRERWFLLAHLNSVGLRDWRERRAKRKAEKDYLSQFDGPVESVAHVDSSGPQGDLFSEPQGEESGRRQSPRPDRALRYLASLARAKGRKRTEVFGRSKAATSAGWWATEPDVVRVVHGLPARIQRIELLGNAVVPLQAKTAFETLGGMR